MAGNSGGSNSDGPSVSITGANVTGATANLSSSDNHSLDIHIAAPVAALAGAESDNFDVANRPCCKKFLLVRNCANRGVFQ